MLALAHLLAGGMVLSREQGSLPVPPLPARPTVIARAWVWGSGPAVVARLRGWGSTLQPSLMPQLCGVLVFAAGKMKPENLRKSHTRVRHAVK